MSPPPEHVPLEHPSSSGNVSAGVTDPGMTATNVAVFNAPPPSHPGFTTATHVPVVQTPQTPSFRQLKGIFSNPAVQENLKRLKQSAFYCQPSHSSGVKPYDGVRPAPYRARLDNLQNMMVTEDVAVAVQILATMSNSHGINHPNANGWYSDLVLCTALIVDAIDNDTGRSDTGNTGARRKKQAIDAANVVVKTWNDRQSSLSTRLKTFDPDTGRPALEKPRKGTPDVSLYTRSTAPTHQPSTQASALPVPLTSAPRTSDELVSQLARTLIWPHIVQPYTGQQPRSLRIGADKDEKGADKDGAHESYATCKALTYPLAVLVGWLQQASDVVENNEGVDEWENTETVAERYSSCLEGLGGCEQLLPLLQDPYLKDLGLRNYLTERIEHLRILAKGKLSQL